MNFICKSLMATVLAMSSLVQALELTDLRLPLTRTEADNFTKDYEYEVLSDISVRRTWRKDGRKIAIDFDSKTDQAICITVTYNQPVPRKDGLEDAKVLAGDKVENPKWKQLKNEAAVKFGMKNAEALQLSDGTYLFREVTDDKKKRFTRLSLYAKMPKEDRAELHVLDSTGGKTALGTSTVSTGIKEIYADEAARRGAAPAVAAKPASAPAAAEEPVSATPEEPRITALGSTPGAREALRRKQEAEAAAAQSVEQAAAPTEAPKTVEKKPAASGVRSNRTLIEALGLDNPGPVQYGVIGGILLIVIIVVSCSVSASKRKAAQKAKYTAILISNQKASSAPKLKRK